MIKTIFALLKKDLLLELRQQHSFYGILLYVASTIFVIYLSISNPEGEVWNGLFWIIQLFVCVNAVAKSFLQESRGRMLYFYTISGAKEFVIAKLIYNIILMLIMSLLSLGLFFILLRNPLSDTLRFIGIVCLGGISLSLVFTLLAAIAAKAQQNAALMAILGFPLIIPQLLLLVRLSKSAFGEMFREGALLQLSLLIVMLAVREAVGPEFAVSVKTRLGFSELQTEEWCGFLLQQPIDALTIHARTVRELSESLPHWDEVKKVVQLRSEIYKNREHLQPALLGNGSVLSIHEGQEIIKETILDGIMFGRGIFQNPWLFNPDYQQTEKGEILNTKTQKFITKTDRLNLMKSHLVLWESTWGTGKSVSILKKYFKIYIHGFEGASTMRAEVMNLSGLKETSGWLNDQLGPA